MTHDHFSWRLGALLAGSMALAGCGGGGSGGDSLASTGTLSLAVTDAPVDSVQHVWVRFTGVRVQPKNGEVIAFTFATPKDIDLLALTGENSVTLLNNETVPAGEYNWIALNVNARFDGTFDSYVVDDMGGMVELQVPSGDQQGLRLVSGFTVTANQNSSFMIDWDLRKGLTNPVGQSGYFLRPALRITDMTRHGTIAGAVDDDLVSADGCVNDLAEDRGNLVYVFEGADVVPADIDGSNNDPLTSGVVAVDPTAAGAYTYSVPFLSPGQYTVAFTCQGLSDDPEVTNAALVFAGVRNATVVHGQTAVVDFP